MIADFLFCVSGAADKRYSLATAMTIEKFEGFLSAIEILNLGCNHGCEYAIYPLPVAETLDASLDLYFSAQWTSSKPAQPAAAWHIRIEELSENWQELLSKRLRYWFFEEEFSPKVEPWVMELFVKQAIALLTDAVGNPKVYEVFVSPPMWYDCIWQDFAFVTNEKKWILHFGYSD